MKNYDKKVKNTRILLADYLVLKQMSQVAGVSMSEALHRLIKHQAQLPLLDRIERPVFQVTGKVEPIQVTGRVVPSRVTGNGVAHIKPKIIKGVS